MSPETIFYLVMFAFIGAAIMGCGIAALIEIYTSSLEYKARQWRKRREKRALANARHYRRMKAIRGY